MKPVAALLGSLTLACTLIIAQTSVGDEQPDPAASPDMTRALFNELDRNGDGRLSFLEAKQDKRLVGKFYRMDLDLDGFLSPEELRRLRV